ncbi:hypothetical protein pb186bvf_003789 [Paramecium bursaria]
MSLFKKSNSLKEKPTQTDKKSDYEAIHAKTTQQISEIDKIIQQTENQLQVLDGEIRKLAGEKKLEAAKSKIIELKQLQQKISGLDNRRQVLFQLQIQIETNHVDFNVVSVMEEGTKIMKDNDLVDKLQDTMLDMQEIIQKQNETDNLFNMIANQNQEEIDNLLNDYISKESQLEEEYAVNEERPIAIPKVYVQQQKQPVKQQIQYN